MPDGVFVAIDFSHMKGIISDSLDADNIDMAKMESAKVLKSQEEIEGSTKSVGGKIVYRDGNMLMVYVSYDEELIESFIDSYGAHMDPQSTNLGIGNNLNEAIGSLHSVQDKGEGNIVTSSDSITENIEKNRQFYRTAKKTAQDIRAAETIKRALSELNVITTDEKVFDIFMKLVDVLGLNTIEAIQSFFYRPLEELKTSIREIYSNQKTAGVVFAVQPQSFPGQTTINISPRQKSVPRRFNWWSIEERNQDSVDYRKTDQQFVSTNVTKDSQDMSMGGEPGNSINVD